MGYSERIDTILELNCCCERRSLSDERERYSPAGGVTTVTSVTVTSSISVARFMMHGAAQ